jgi:N-acetylglucosamine kinase-like BadF-type ATPase
MPVYIGIDGGGTKTRAVAAAADGQILADLTAEGCNINRFGWARVWAVLSDLFDKIRGAVPAPEEISGVYLGMAGVDREEDRARMGAWVQNEWPGVRTAVEHDALPALVGGTGTREGIVLIAGTGSIAFGIDRAGNECRVGGWGYLIGDEGSGYDIGRRGLQAVMKSHDGRLPQTMLTGLLLDHYGLEEPSALIPLAYAESFSRDRMAEVARFVFAAAKAGDRVCGQLLDHASEDLGELVDVLLGRLQFVERPVPVVLTGGLFHPGSLLTERVRRRLEPAVTVVQSPRPPVAGALLLARNLCEETSATDWQTLVQGIKP